MNTPHKHAAIIKAWADGAQIERRFGQGKWHDFPSYAIWEEAAEYRVKPEPHKWQKEMDAYKAGKVIQFRWRHMGPSEWGTCNREPMWLVDGDAEYRIKPEQVERFYHAYGETFAVHMNQDKTRPHANLKLTYEDGELVKAEVLK